MINKKRSSVRDPRNEEGKPTILIIDDDPTVVDTCERGLRGFSYNILTAYGGKEGLGMMDNDVDVVLLDRLMPKMRGEEVLKEIRDRKIGCWVAMLTAVDPDYDIIDMEFDDYIVKPISMEDLRLTVEHLLERGKYNSKVREFFSASSKLAVLEKRREFEELRRNEKYIELNENLEELRDGAYEKLQELYDDGFVEAFNDIPRYQV